MIDEESWAHIPIHKDTSSDLLVTPTVDVMTNVDPSNIQLNLLPMTTPLTIMTILGDLVCTTPHYPTVIIQGPGMRNLIVNTHPTFTILRKINFLIWGRIWPALGYFQAIGVLGMQFWALFGVSDFYLFRQVWSLTNLWPCSNFGFPRSIFFFLAPKHPPWWVEHGCVKWSRVPPVCSPIPGPWFLHTLHMPHTCPRPMQSY